MKCFQTFLKNQRKNPKIFSYPLSKHLGASKIFGRGRSLTKKLKKKKESARHIWPRNALTNFPSRLPRWLIFFAEVLPAEALWQGMSISVDKFRYLSILSIFVDICRYLSILSIFVDIWRYLSIFGDFIRHLLTSVDICWYFSTLFDICRYLSTFVVIYRHLSISVDIFRYLSINGDICRWLSIFVDKMSINVDQTHFQSCFTIIFQIFGRLLSFSKLYIMKSCTSRLLQGVTLSTRS